MLKKLWNYSREDSLVRDSLLLLAAATIMNLGGFLFHLFMGRFLGPSSYSVLGVILAIIYILSVPINSIQTVITKFVSQFSANNERDKINVLLRKSFLKLGAIGLLILIISILLVPLASNFLHIPKSNLYVLSPIILFSALIPITRGGLQGLQKFKALGLNMIFEISVKLGLGIALVYTILKVNGAIIAIVLSIFIPSILGLIPIRSYLGKKTIEGINTKEIYKYAYPIILALTFLILLFSVDIFLIKHFFSSEDAGLYIAAALIGKIIFFATFSISQVMFPKSVENFTKKRSSIKIIKKSIILALLIAVPITISYFIFPDFVIKILFGNEYLSIRNLIGFFGIAITFFSLSYILALYNLSINKIKFVIPLVLANIFEIYLIYMFHNSLLQVTIIITSIMAAVFIYMLLYTLISAKWSSSQ